MNQGRLNVNHTPEMCQQMMKRSSDSDYTPKSFNQVRCFNSGSSSQIMYIQYSCYTHIYIHLFTHRILKSQFYCSQITCLFFFIVELLFCIHIYHKQLCIYIYICITVCISISLLLLFFNCYILGIIINVLKIALKKVTI